MLAAAAGVGAGATVLWHYNRSNFLYDRKLRQEQEFAIFDWRKVQAELWREDVRDIIEMTEKKMDNYLIVSVLQLGMCAGLFACGRLEPGTPPWLLHFYMLSLGGAFMYLLMSVWLAMHAGVVAQCASVRMLTQFIRLPVPNWDDFEGARTYARSFEALRPEDMLRMPFTPSLATGDQPAAASMPKSAAGPGYREWNTDPSSVMSSKPGAMTAAVDSATEATPIERPQHADPWRLERHGDDRGFYELERVRLQLRRHIRLARRAALQFQCFDAFARLAMSFGTHQLLYALAFYALGYVVVQDGVVMPAASVVAICAGISSMMLHVDFAMTLCERVIGVFLTVSGLAAGSCSVFLWIRDGAKADGTLSLVLPVTYIANLFWLLNSLRACNITEDPTTGVVLPLKLRAVLYLDVFGWLSKSPAERCTPLDRKWRQHAMRAESTVCTEPLEEPSPKGTALGAPKAGRWWQRVFGRRKGDESRPERRPAYEKLQSASDFTSVNTNHALFASMVCEPADAEERGRLFGVPEVECHGPGGEIHMPPEHAFEPSTYDACPEQLLNDGKEIVTGQDRLRPSKMPGQLFRRGTLFLASMWACAFVVPLEIFGVFLARPAVADIFFDTVHENGELVSEKEIHAVVGTDINGLPELRAIASPQKDLPALGESRRLHVAWPSHSAFVPHAMAVDRTGEYVIVADDFGLYAGTVHEVAETSAAMTVAGILPERRLNLRFKSMPLCASLEGVSILDVSAACTEDHACDVFVLSGGGRNITRCPVGDGRPQAMVVGSSLDAVSWTLNADWVEKGEMVRSLAVRRDCWDATGRVGDECMVVGTSQGRIVELFAADARGSGGALLPMTTWLEAKQASTSGSLAALSDRVTLALWFRRGVLTAVDRGGSLLGEWQLPGGLYWLMIGCGGDYIFVLGVRKAAPVRRKARRRGKSLVELHRFPLPGELRAALTAAATQ
mmetsp:Transcript_119169/g.344714  ORF Transcript_119169/g.344714 Transcript_119169/m.344714 type:complete len:958 (+) Transcript_119169:50-2923(+)